MSLNGTEINLTEDTWFNGTICEFGAVATRCVQTPGSRAWGWKPCFGSSWAASSSYLSPGKKRPPEFLPNCSLRLRLKVGSGLCVRNAPWKAVVSPPSAPVFLLSCVCSTSKLMDSVERSHQRQPWLFSTAGTSEMESKSKISLFLLCYQQHPMLFSLFFLLFFSSLSFPPPNSSPPDHGKSFKSRRMQSIHLGHKCHYSLQLLKKSQEPGAQKRKLLNWSKRSLYDKIWRILRPCSEGPGGSLPIFPAPKQQKQSRGSRASQQKQGRGISVPYAQVTAWVIVPCNPCCLWYFTSSLHHLGKQKLLLFSGHTVKVYSLLCLH